MVIAEAGFEPQTEVIPEHLICIDMYGSQVVSKVSVNCCEEFFPIRGSPFSCLFSLFYNSLKGALGN
jgi:hypothetical protein